MGHGELVGIGRFRRRLPHLPLNRFFPPFWGQRDGICYGHQQQPPPHSTTSAAAAAAAAAVAAAAAAAVESGTKTRQLAVGTKTGHVGGRETGILRKQQYPPPSAHLRAAAVERAKEQAAAMRAFAYPPTSQSRRHWGAYPLHLTGTHKGAFVQLCGIRVVLAPACGGCHFPFAPRRRVAQNQGLGSSEF